MPALVRIRAFSPVAVGVIQSTSGMRPERVCMVVSRQTRRSRWRETTHQKCATARFRPERVTTGAVTALLSRANGSHRPSWATPAKVSTSSAAPAASSSSARIRQRRVSGPARCGAQPWWICISGHLLGHPWRNPELVEARVTVKAASEARPGDRPAPAVGELVIFQADFAIRTGHQVLNVSDYGGLASADSLGTL